MQYADLFNELPPDAHLAQRDSLSETLQKLGDMLEPKDEDCWVPKEGAPKSAYILGAYKPLQIVADMLGTYINNDVRAKSKIVTSCNNPDCCNPKHLHYVQKKYTLDEALRNHVQQYPNFDWNEFRSMIKILRGQRIMQMQDLQRRLYRSDLRPDIRVECQAQFDFLEKRYDYEYVEAVRKTLFAMEETPITLRFFAYIQSRGLLNYWSRIPEAQRKYIANLLRDKHPYTEDGYFALVIVSAGELLDNYVLREMGDKCYAADKS